MARNYNKTGFGEGFAQGFGLVQDAMDSHARRRQEDRRLDIAERKLDENDAYNQQRLETEKLKTKAAELAINDANKLAKEQKAAATLTLLDNRLNSNELVDEDFINQLIADTQGTVFDVFDNLSADALNNSENIETILSNLQQGKSPDQNTIDGVMKSLFDSQVRQGTNVGRTLGADDIYAPDAYKNGNWTVTGVEFDSARYLNHPTDPSKSGFKGKMLVKIKNAQGQEAMYSAPITKGAVPNGEVLTMNNADLLRVTMGKHFTHKHFQKYRSTIDNALKKNLYGSEEKYQTAKREKVAELTKFAEDFPEAPSPVKGITNEQLMARPDLIEAYADDMVLRGKSGVSFKSDKDSFLEAVLSDKAIQNTNKIYKQRTGKDLNAENLFYLNSILGDKDYRKKANQYLFGTTLPRAPVDSSKMLNSANLGAL